jgi:hypothetical protein
MNQHQKSTILISDLKLKVLRTMNHFQQMTRLRVSLTPREDNTLKPLQINIISTLLNLKKYLIGLIESVATPKRLKISIIRRSKKEKRFWIYLEKSFAAMAG